MHLKKPSFRQTDFSPGWTYKSGSLPNFGVNTTLDCLQEDQDTKEKPKN
jgi:hypothetical protein